MALKRTAWNVGLTKDTDSRIKACSDKRTGQTRIIYQVICEICGKSFNQFGIKSHIQFSHIKKGSPMKGLHHTKEAKEKNRQKHLGNIAWNKGLKGFRKGIPNTKEQNDKIRQKRLLQIIPFKDTLPERKIQEILDSANIKYEKHTSLLGKYQSDVLIKPNIVVFVDGDYWHNLPKARLRDEQVTQDLLNNGYVVLRFWEHEILNTLEDCFNRLIYCINFKFGGKIRC